MTGMTNALKAKYQANKNIFVTCYLTVIGATAKGFKAQVGIYQRGDTILPTGTKLFIPSEEAPSEEAVASKQIELYYVVVEGVDIIKSIPVQQCSPISRTLKPEQRETPRIEKTTFSAVVKEYPDRPVHVLGGSAEGLTLQMEAPQVFLNLLLGQHLTLEARYKTDTLKLPVELVHLQYDWSAHQHRLGVKILEINKNQQMILNFLLDPEYSIHIAEASSVDAEEARIMAE